MRGVNLDPDFRFLSYGDSRLRATRIRTFFDGSLDNFIAFYASFEPIYNNPRPLVYAIIGLYRFQNVEWAKNVLLNTRERNAHTRLVNYQNDDNHDIVIFADQNNRSGRLKTLMRNVPPGLPRAHCISLIRHILRTGPT